MGCLHRRYLKLVYCSILRTSSPCGVISVTGKASKSSSVVMSCTYNDENDYADDYFDEDDGVW